MPVAHMLFFAPCLYVFSDPSKPVKGRGMVRERRKTVPILSYWKHLTLQSRLPSSSLSFPPRAECNSRDSVICCCFSFPCSSLSFSLDITITTTATIADNEQIYIYIYITCQGCLKKTASQIPWSWRYKQLVITWCGWWEPNSASLEEHQILWTFEPSLQSL